MAEDVYFAPYIDESGLHIPTFQAILNKRIEDAKLIFGQDIYLDNDSVDYQSLSVESLSLYEVMQALQLTYNNMSPQTAVGAGLSSLIRLNGMSRKKATNSTCDILLTGTSAATITNGIVQDVSGNLWNLPTPITLVASGSPVGSTYQLTVTATCQTAGSIVAAIGDINVISTPVAGWTSVVNLVEATMGTDVETDSQLRERQTISTELPSQTMLEGTIAAIADIDGVTRYKVYENPSNSTHYGDEDVPFEGSPEHSITCVVEGGTIADISQAIYDNRGNGCYMDGDIETPIVDDYGNSTTVRFYRPTYVNIYVDITIKKLNGYVSSVEDLIIAAIIDYINSLDISAELTISSIIYAVMALQTNQAKPTFSISSLEIGRLSSPVVMGTDNIVFEYNEVANCDEYLVTLSSIS